MALWHVDTVELTAHGRQLGGRCAYPFAVVGTYTAECSNELAGTRFSWRVPTLDHPGFDLGSAKYGPGVARVLMAGPACSMAPLGTSR